jgi:hypothetical protein
MNYKRKKSKRNVKCTICTDLRWMGNTNGRRRHSDSKNMGMLTERRIENIRHKPSLYEYLN